MYFKRLAAIVIGAAISAYGITLALGAGFGSATLAVLWEGVSVTFGVTTGVSSMIIAALMLLFVFFYDRKQIHVGTIVYQIVYSSSLDFFAALHRFPESKALCFLIMLAAIAIFATGNGLYASARLGRGSYEALTYSFVDRNHWSVQIVRMALDLTFVVLGWLLGGHFGVCTLFTILLSGPIMQRAAALFTRALHFDTLPDVHAGAKKAG